MPLPNDIRLISRIGAVTESVIVVMVAFGSFIWQSTVYAAWLWKHPGWAAEHAMFDPTALQGLIVGEIATGLFLLAFLWIRGWTAERAGLSLTVRSTAMGIGLAFVIQLASTGAFALARAVWPAQVAASAGSLPTGSSLDAPLIMAASGANGVFEELFLCGYLISAQGSAWQRGVLSLVSMAIRLSYHTYQGPLGLLNILIFGSLLTAFFLRTKKLWPLVVAHICLDLVGLWGLQ